MFRFMPQDEAPCYRPGGVPRLAFAARLRMEGERMSRPLHAFPDVTTLWLVCRGRVRVLLGADRLYAETGDVFVIHAGTVADLVGEGEAELMAVGVQGLQLEGLPPNVVLEGCPALRLRADSETRELEVLFGVIARQVQERPAHAAAVCASALSILINRVRQLLDHMEQAPEPRSDLACQLYRYLDAHYTETISLPLLADLFYISPYYAAHVFKEEIGYSIIQYVSRRRIGEAQTLLVMTDESVTQIADRVGYDNPNYFSTAFNKLVGLSPQRYRQAMRGE